MEEKEKIEFSQRLKKLLIKKGFPVNKKGKIKNRVFANAMNKGESVTLGWLNGRIPGLTSDIKALSKFLNVSTDFLLFGEGSIERRMEPRREDDKLKALLVHSLLSPRKEYTFKVKIEAQEGPDIISEMLLNFTRGDGMGGNES